ncbi:MAG TPA: O-antigen ligase family protein [Puia sp.]|nr:O-antigen ligase family protein [Puia sp.]
MTSVEISLLLAVITMPYSYLWNSYSIVLFSILAFFSNSWQNKINNIRRKPFFLIWPAILYSWMALSLVWDHGSKSTACIIEGLEGGISWLVLPLVFSFVNTFDPNSIRKILFAFVASIIAGSFYCLYQAYWDYSSTHYINFFFYHHLSAHIGISAIYYSMYCVFGIYILLFYFHFTPQSRTARFYSMLLIAWLVLFIMLLSSKTLIFLLYISAAIFTVYAIYYYRSRWGIMIMMLLLITIPILLIKFPYVNARVRDTQIKEYSGPADNQNGLAVRGVLWESSWNLITQKPTFGWGKYGAQEALQRQYMQMGFVEGQKGNYNSHNQYIYTWLCFGLIGLLLLFVYFARLFRFFVRSKEILGISLVLLFLLANITECMLEVQKGIVFIMLFGNLFLFHPLRLKLK